MPEIGTYGSVRAEGLVKIARSSATRFMCRKMENAPQMALNFEEDPFRF
jgi:hypothetical protein